MESALSGTLKNHAKHLHYTAPTGNVLEARLLAYCLCSPCWHSWNRHHSQLVPITKAPQLNKNNEKHVREKETFNLEMNHCSFLSSFLTLWICNRSSNLNIQKLILDKNLNYKPKVNSTNTLLVLRLSFRVSMAYVLTYPCSWVCELWCLISP